MIEDLDDTVDDIRTPEDRARLRHVYVLDLQTRSVVATVTGVGHDPYALAVVVR